MDRQVLISAGKLQNTSPVNICEMERIAVDLDLSSIGKDVLVINAIQIQDPLINFEGKADGGSNMQMVSCRGGICQKYHIRL